MDKKLRIAVLFGGRSGEHEVSLMSARSVLANLDTEKYEITQVGITHGGGWLTGDDVLGAFERGQYGRLSPAVLPPSPANPRLYMLEAGYTGETMRLLTTVDVVFPVLHGTFGEDGTIQGLLELLDMPYVGSGVLASAAAMDKVISKQLFAQAGLASPEYLVLRTGEAIDTAAITAELGPKTVVKPANEGSAIGVTIAFVGIVNTMLMSVTERFREIGTFKCLGALDSFVVRIFVLEAFYQGLIGGTAGGIAGIAVATLSLLFSVGLPVLYWWPPR